MYDSGEKRVHIMGIPIYDCNPADLIDTIMHAVRNKQAIIVAHVNIYALNLAYEQPQIYDFFARYANIVFCDGFGVKLGGRLRGVSIQNRLTWPDWIGKLCQHCVEQDYSLFLLGARDGVAERAADRLTREYPQLRIVGTHHGYFDKQTDSTENQKFIEQIHLSKPDIVLIAFGMALQEIWLLENWPRINASTTLTVGALLDYLAGEIQRPPKWMTDHGLEWAGRLRFEPRRLWRRYLIGIPIFFWRLLKYGLSIKPEHLKLVMCLGQSLCSA